MLRRTFTAVIPDPMTRTTTVHYTGTVPVTTGFTMLGMLGCIGTGIGADTAVGRKRRDRRHRAPHALRRARVHFVRFWGDEGGIPMMTVMRPHMPKMTDRKPDPARLNELH